MSNYEQLTQFLGELKAAEDDNTALFHDLISRSATVLGLTDKDFAKGFKISRPSVNRWRNGMSAPQPVMRKYVYDFLVKRTQELIRLHEKEERKSTTGTSGRGGSFPMAASGRY